MPRVPVRQPPSLTPDGQKAAREGLDIRRELDKVKAAIPTSPQLWTGAIVISADGVTPPAGWRACDGSELARLDYPEYFAAFGETYGAGDGATTVNLPTIPGPAADTTVYIYVGRA